MSARRFSATMVAIFVAWIAGGAEFPGTRENWKLELIAEAPKIRHPSVVACAPDGKVFVAEDPMDITRPANVAEGRIICFHPDGRVTTFAENLHAVFGMQYLEGKLYVLHNPAFSVFADVDGKGRDRNELIGQTNPNPWALDWNDHVPANFRLGMDGRFYVAVGDKGIYGAVGRDGKPVNLHGGGILRLRPDGTDLEVFATGTRNILDVAMTEEDEVFTYDNTDEHQWMGRLTHMVDGGFYGYPFDFIPRRPYTLWMIADYGPGAATGTTVSTDDALSPELRGNLFLGDFGQRNVRRVVIERDGGTFRVAKDEQLFVNPPGDFRPVGIAFSDDGRSLYVCDWQHRDTKENDANTGRLWKLSWVGKDHSSPRPKWYPTATNATESDLLTALEHPARSVRMAAQRELVRRGEAALPKIATVFSANTTPLAKAHAIWAADQMDQGQFSRESILKLARDENPVVARQAVRQLGNCRAEEAIPVLTDLLKSSDASIRFAAATALGRIGDSRSAEALLLATADGDLFARYAAFTALNRIGRGSPNAWTIVIRGLGDSNPRVREAGAFAMRETYDKDLVRLLAAVMSRASSAKDLKVAVLNAMAPLHHKPDEWKGEWWAYHPFRLPPPAKTNAWEGTAIIFDAMSAGLNDPASAVRKAASQGLQLFGTERAGDLLMARVERETEPEVRQTICAALAGLKYSKAEGLAAASIRAGDLNPAVLALARASGGQEVVKALRGAVKSDAAGAETAIEALADVGGKTNGDVILAATTAGRLPKRVAAIKIAASLLGPGAVEFLMKLRDDPLPDIRATANEALTTFSDVRALNVYLDGLASKNAPFRAASQRALTKIREEAWPLLEPKLKTLDKAAIAELQRIYRGHKGAEAAGLNRIPVDTVPREAYLEYALANAGDATHGETLFKDRNGVACINCHRVSGEGVDIGPDLSGVGAQFDRRALAENILWPSRAVREGYNVVELEMTDGESVSGMIRAETSEALSVQPASGPPVAIPKSKIKARKSTALSLMPEGLESSLSLDDFADLVSYLQGLKSGT